LHDIETVIVGAGVVGLALARRLAMAGHEVVVLEQHDIIGSETSARNSEVIHAGIYYSKGSLKAQTCVAGKRRLYEFCASHNVPHKRIGKLIVATDEAQRSTLDSIARNAHANGVNDLIYMDKRAVGQIEPALNCVGALFSPSTGIIDSHAYMIALRGDAELNGCQIAFNTKAISWRPLSGGGFEIVCSGDEETKLTARNLVVCGGLHAAQFLSASNFTHAVKPTLFAKGNYFRLAVRSPFSHLIYPVPEPGGLGVHLTLDMSGQARFGPDVEWINEIDYEVNATRVEEFYNSIRSYWPDLPDASLVPDYAGIRPKLSGPREPDSDFEIWGVKAHGQVGLVGLLGIESPGLTASLEIAEIVRETLT